MHFTYRPARQLALAAGLLGFASLAACNKDKDGGEFAKTKSGIEYKIFKKVGSSYERREIGPDGDPTYKTRIGKFLLGYMQYRTGKDSVLQNSRKDVGMAVPLPLAEVTKKGAPDEALSLLQPGDSGVFRFQVDSLFKKGGQPAPAFLKRGGNIVLMYVATTAKLATQPEVQAMQPLLQAAQQRRQMASPEYKKQMQDRADQVKKAVSTPEAVAQFQKDDALLQEYIKKNGLTMKKTASGLYYQILKQGAGPNAVPGQKISMNYSGVLLSGKEFDSTAKHGGAPFDFVLGQYQVITGWDEGVALLNKGSRAIFLIPSPLAYGTQGAGADIPANTPLKFDVEVLDIKDNK